MVGGFLSGTVRGPDHRHSRRSMPLWYGAGFGGRVLP